MGTRLDLQEILENILGSRNVYFQPPESIKLRYPCIIYEKTPGDQKHADDIVYSYMNRYKLTVIDRDPDTVIPDKIRELKYQKMSTSFCSDNLYHYIFDLYY